MPSQLEVSYGTIRRCHINSEYNVLRLSSPYKWLDHGKHKNTPIMHIGLAMSIFGTKVIKESFDVISLDDKFYFSGKDNEMDMPTTHH